jgi:ferredoxin
MFGNALKNAFGNDDDLGKAQNAGLTNVSLRFHGGNELMTQVLDKHQAHSYLHSLIIHHSSFIIQGPQQNDSVTLNGKKVKAVVGQKVSVVAAQNRVKISYNCKAGDCGTCIVNINGRKQKACQMSIPSGKCNINTL